MKKQVLTPLQKTILKAWAKTKVVHPSYGEIAKALGCSADTVFRTVNKYALKK